MNQCGTCKHYTWERGKGASCRPGGTGKKTKAYAGTSGQDCWEEKTPAETIKIPGVGEIPASDAELIAEEIQKDCFACYWRELSESGETCLNEHAINHERTDPCPGFRPMEMAEPVEPTLARDDDFGTKPPEPTFEESQSVVDDPEASTEEKLAEQMRINERLKKQLVDSDFILSRCKEALTKYRADLSEELTKLNSTIAKKEDEREQTEADLETAADLLEKLRNLGPHQAQLFDPKAEPEKLEEQTPAPADEKPDPENESGETADDDAEEETETPETPETPDEAHQVGSNMADEVVGALSEV